MPVLEQSATRRAADAAVASMLLALEDVDGDVGRYAAAVDAAGVNLAERFLSGEPVGDLVRLRALIIDELLVHLWRHCAGDAANEIALVAVGGYGRGELHPGSDIDVMLLADDQLQPEAEAAISTFLATLWDIGLEIGHSVRSVAQCAREAAADISVATTLMEARLVSGSEKLFQEIFHWL